MYIYPSQQNLSPIPFAARANKVPISAAMASLVDLLKSKGIPIVSQEVLREAGPIIDIKVDTEASVDRALQVLRKHPDYKQVESKFKPSKRGIGLITECPELFNAILDTYQDHIVSISKPFQPEEHGYGVRLTRKNESV